MAVAWRRQVELSDRQRFHDEVFAAVPDGVTGRVGGWILGAHEALVLELDGADDVADFRPHLPLERALQDAEHLHFVAGATEHAGRAPGLLLSVLADSGRVELWASALHHSQNGDDDGVSVRVVALWRWPFRQWR